MKKILLLVLILISLSGCNKINNNSNETVSNKMLEVTEKEDSKETDKTTENQLVFQNESTHFKFYCDEKDIEILTDVTQALEDNYDRITDDLKTYLEKKTNVYIYNDIETFHKGIGMPNAEEWVVGVMFNNEVHMVSPSNGGKIHDYDSIIKVVVHEFTHVVTNNINNNIPKWLSDGIATYESQQYPRFNKDLKEDEIPELLKLESKSFYELNGYSFGYTLVEFIVEKYGYSSVVDLIKDPNNYEELFGFNKEEFENQWRTFFIDKYIK